MATALLLCACQAARAANVTVGNHLLLANTPNQVISIQISGGEQVAGEDFYAQIGDGGSFNGGNNTKPSFSGGDLLTGSIFAANNTGSQPGNNAAHPLIWVDHTITTTGTVSASGLLAKLTVDTTGLSSGTFPLSLTSVASSLGSFNTKLLDANGAPISLNVTNGSLVISLLPLADYNHNGVADAADYIVWRKTVGQTGAGLAADGDHDNAVTQADYDLWKMEFGYVSSGSGAAANVAPAAVPEPRSATLIAVGLFAFVIVALQSKR